jgi:hypothetical protein
VAIERLIASSHRVRSVLLSAAKYARLAPIVDGLDAPVHVELGKVYQLAGAAQAHRDVEKHHLGKLALRIH